MAKSNTAQTMSPFEMIAGLPVWKRHAAAIEAQLSYAAGYTPVYLAGYLGGLVGWVTNAGRGLGVTFDDTQINTWVRRAEFVIDLDPDIQTLQLEAVCDFDIAPNAGEVRVVINSNVGTTLSFTSADNGARKTGTFTLTSVGGSGVGIFGYLEIRQTAGAASDNQLVRWSLYGVPVTDANNYPDPSG